MTYRGKGEREMSLLLLIWLFIQHGGKVIQFYITKQVRVYTFNKSVLRLPNLIAKIF